MKFLEWENKQIGEFDIFAVVSEKEKNMIISYFGTNRAESVSFANRKQYFYFINSKNKTIAPMPKLSMAFGGMYNGCPPYGDEIRDFSFDITQYEIKYIAEKVTKVF